LITYMQFRLSPRAISRSFTRYN